MVEAAELVGPAFKDQQIVLGFGSPPAKVKKDLAWTDATLKSRMGAYEPPVAAE